MSDIALINDSQQSAIVTNGIGKNGEIYMKAAGSTDAGALVVYDSGVWRKFADEASSYSNAYSVSFDGSDDYINCGNASSLAPANITLSAWIKVSGSVDTFNYILSKAGSRYGSIHLRYTSGNKFNVHLGFASAAFINNITSSSSYTLTDWHHVVFTYDQTNVKLYVDGVEEYSAAETRAIDYAQDSGGSTDFNIGRTAYGYASPAEGLIDEVSLFDSALSSSDITSIYNSGVPNDISSLSPVGWWRMGENDGGTGTTITDQGSGGNNGTLTNGPTFSSDVPS